MINDGYYALFVTMAQGASNMAEAVMEENQKSGDLQGYKTAKQMRDNYTNLYYKCKDSKPLDKNDFANLYLASSIMVTKLESEIKKSQEVLKHYKEILVPKLKMVATITETDIENLVEKEFSIN